MQVRPVKGFEDRYLINEVGEVRRQFPCRYGAVVTPFASPRGYLSVRLYGGAGSPNFYVHRLVAEAFLGYAPDDKTEVAHGDGSKNNNHFSNLRWADRSDNARDMRKHGTTRKLTENKVSEIKTRRAAGETTVALSKEYGVSAVMISRIALGHAWA